MLLSEIYKKAIKTAIENDPRGKEAVIVELNSRKKHFDDIKPSEKEYFDAESLNNPYADSRILYGTGNEKISSIMIGIDIDPAELMIADHLRSNKRPVDLVLSHHPSGGALANLHAVMYMQADILNTFGVPVNIAESLTESRVKEVERKLLPTNHTRTVDAARLLDMPFMCLHTAADNMVATYLQRMFDNKKPITLDNIVEMLMGIPEYKEAKKNHAGPKIVVGSGKRKAGKVFVDMTGGTEGAKDIFQSLSSSGINTIVGMHISEEHRKEAEKNHINVVIAGHISSDNLGLNLLLDEVFGKKKIEIIECAGFRRFSRI
ncbi:MAG: NGG1p interacting factor NIF3 [Nitrospirae bacterium]|nr:NGG1p interacting factor NIF3 [Nitrospirota bacterium]